MLPNYSEVEPDDGFVVVTAREGSIERPAGGLMTSASQWGVVPPSSPARVGV